MERRHAPLPSNTPSATRGTWITNRYVVNDYIVLSDDGIEQAFQPLVELANWTIPEIAENITAFFTESIPLEI